MKQLDLAGSDKNTPARVIYFEQLWSQDWTAAGLLFLLGLLSRLPFQSQILYHWDSVNFSFALREFNVLKEQPQPPGYILYVWLARLVDLVYGDAPTTLVMISTVASALAIVALYFLGRSMFNRQVGLVAALFLATSPLFWFYSEIALPHPLDTLLVILSIWWLYETMKGNRRYIYPAVVVLAIAGGIRQQTLVFLAPALFFALRWVGWKRFFVAGTLGAIICLAWFIPLIVASDGFSNYMRIMGDFSRRFQTSTSIFMGAGWWGVRRNLIKLIIYTLYGWSIPLLAFVIYSVVRIQRPKWPHSERVIFLLLWITPALLFYTLIHMGQQGLVFVFLPALLLLSAVGLTRIFATRPRLFALATAAFIAVNIGIFTLIPEYPLGPGTQRFLTRATLINSDQFYQARFEAIEKNFPPEATLILAANWHHLEYYLPEYKIQPFDLGSKWEQNAGIPQNNFEDILIFTPSNLGLQLKANKKVAIVLFEPELAQFNQTPEFARQVTLLEGVPINYLYLGPNDQFQLEASSFALVSP